MFLYLVFQQYLQQLFHHQLQHDLYRSATVVLIENEYVSLTVYLLLQTFNLNSQLKNCMR